jgi:hypothetical protein
MHPSARSRPRSLEFGLNARRVILTLSFFVSLSQRTLYMDNLQLKQVPVVKTGMLIRKPVTEVFKAL